MAKDSEQWEMPDMYNALGSISELQNMIQKQNKELQILGQQHSPMTDPS